MQRTHATRQASAHGTGLGKLGRHCSWQFRRLPDTLRLDDILAEIPEQVAAAPEQPKSADTTGPCIVWIVLERTFHACHAGEKFDMVQN